MALQKNSVRMLCAGALVCLFFASSVGAQTQEVPPSTPSPESELEALLKSYQDRIPTQNAIITASISGSISLTQDPETPSAHQAVAFTVSSVLTDLDRATITWYQNGVLKEQGKGKKVFSTQTGAFGSVSTVSVVVLTTEGVLVTKRSSLKPLDVELVWEADTYTPPFYKGKALPSPGSDLRVFARPIGASGADSSFVYRWKVDGKSVPSASGYGKSTATLPGLFLGGKTATVEVSIASLDETVRATKSITIRGVTPRILLYEDRPLEGIRYGRALGTTAVAPGNEMTVRVEPFFLSKDARTNGSVLYRWTLDGGTVPTVESSGSGLVFGEYGTHRLTLFNDGSAQKMVSLGLSVRSTASLFSSVNKLLTVSLGGKPFSDNGSF